MEADQEGLRTRRIGDSRGFLDQLGPIGCLRAIQGVSAFGVVFTKEWRIWSPSAVEKWGCDPLDSVDGGV